MNITPKQIEAIIGDLWDDYFSDMSAGRMRQAPGRTELEWELQKLGLLPSGGDSDEWRDWFFNVWANEKSRLRKAILRATRRAQKKRKSIISAVEGEGK